MAWRSSREADLDAWADEALADPTIFASCCGLAILRRTASGFHLHQGCAGLRQAPEKAKTSEDEKSFAVEVMQRLFAGDHTLTDLISTNTLKDVSLAQWNNLIKEAAKMEKDLCPGEAVLVQKSQGWIVFHKSLSKGKLEFKIAVDATNRQILGMSLQKIGDEVVETGKGGREAEALAVKVVQMVLDGEEDSLVGMLAPTLESVCEADWRHFLQDVIVPVTKIVKKPYVAGKKQGWWIIPVKTTDDLLVFEVVVDAQTQQILGLTVEKEMPELDGQREPSPVEINDSWHIGSCAKSMTATLAAILISKELLPSFQLSVQTALKDDPILGPAAMKSGFKDVTLELLLTNRGGCWGTPDNDLWNFAWKLPGSQSTASSELHRTARRQYIEGVLALTPHEIDQYEYSNDGFALAGVMMETFVDMAYEDLMNHYIFEPLQMTHSGFGAMGVSRPSMAERCHYIWGTRDEALDPEGPGGDNPQVIAPAGCVHCSLEDMGHYLACHLSSETAATLLGISQQCWELLHQPRPKMESGYAMGWRVKRTEEHYTLTHCGSNYMHFMCMKLWPSEGIAAIVTFNMGVEAARPAELIADRLHERARNLGIEDMKMGRIMSREPVVLACH